PSNSVCRRCSLFFFSSRRRHTRWPRDWSSDVCSSDLLWAWPTALSNNFREKYLLVGRSLENAVGHAHNRRSRRGEKRFIDLRVRSEERRVGKEWRSRWSRAH